MKNFKKNMFGFAHHALFGVLVVGIIMAAGYKVLTGTHALQVASDGGGGGYTNGPIYSGGYMFNAQGKGAIKSPSGFESSANLSNMSFGGKKVAYYSASSSGTKLYRFDPTIGNASALASPPSGTSAVTAPVFSPDGLKLATAVYTGGDGYYPFEIWIARTDSTASHVVKNVQTPISPYIAWRPSSASIMYSRAGVAVGTGTAPTAGTICTIEAIGINNKCFPIAMNGVAVTTLGGWLGETGLAVSPTGGKVAMGGRTVHPGPGGPESVDIYTLNPNGSGLKRVTTNDAGQAVSAMVWSPDGTKIAYMLRPTGSSASSPGGLYVINADGSGKQQISTFYSENSLSWTHL